MQLGGVEKTYGAIRALRDFSIAISAGEIHALCGHNGAGKSTAVKVLAGLVRPDEGTIHIDGEEVSLRTPQQAQRAGVALVDQEVSLIDVLSVADNLVLGQQGAPFLRHRQAGQSDVRRLLARVGLADLDPRTLVGTLSMGERQLVEIARALGREAGLLILDEPTATLSEAEIEHVFAAVRSVAREGAAVMFVSHRLGEVLQLCNRVTVLRDGQRVTTAATADLDRNQLINLMLGHQPREQPRPARRPQSQGEVVSIRALTVPPRVSEFSLDVAAGDVVAIAGQVGSGASEVLRAIAGLSPQAGGDVTVAGRRLTLGSVHRSVGCGVGFLSNDRKAEGLFLDRSVDANLLATRLDDVTRLGVVTRRSALRTAGRLAENVGLQARRAALARHLSGGNQQKVFLGRALERRSTKLLLLDEPTRGVDVGGRSDIHRLVREAAAAGTAVMFSSTELDEILDLADLVVTMFAGRVVAVRPAATVTAAQVLADMTHASIEEVVA